MNAVETPMRQKAETETVAIESTLLDSSNDDAVHQGLMMKRHLVKYLRLPVRP